MADRQGTSENMAALSALSPEARARVEKALKEAIDREAVEGVVASGGLGAAGNIFSRGWIFSRLTPTAEKELERILPEISKMGSEDFLRFASRLAELKAKTSPQR